MPSEPHDTQTPDELVRVLRAAGSSPARDEAAAALHARIRPWAEQAVRGNSGQLARDFVEEAPDRVVGERLSKYEPTGRFEAWCRTTLRHLWFDRLRQHRTEQQRREGGLMAEPDGDARRGDAGGDPAAEPDLEGAREEVAAHLAELRRGLDTVASSPGRQRDPHAVLLLQLRLVLTRQAQDAGITSAEAGVDRLADWIAVLLPWRADEQDRRPRYDLPSLGRIWSDFAAAAEQAEGPAGAALVVETINRLAGEPRVTRAQWYQWVSRACRHVQQYHPGLYEQVFTPWLDRQHRAGG